MASSTVAAEVRQENRTTEGTLNLAFQTAVRQFGDRPAVSHKVNGQWVDITYSDLAAQIWTLASALDHLGVRKGDRIAILAENEVNWTLVDFAALALGAATVPIYATLPPNQVAYILKDSGARIVFAGDRSQLRKIEAIRAETPDLQQVVVFDGSGGDGTRSMEDVMQVGRDNLMPPDDYRARWASVQPDDMATLIYTSGTTGDPKGVDLTHGNFVFIIQSARALLRWDESDIFLSFLPLCHIYERACGHYLPLTTGVKVGYVEGKSTLERISKLPGNFTEVRPTVFLGTPRLYEKMKEKIEDSAARSGPKKKKIFDWALQVGMRAARREMRGLRVDPLTLLERAIARRLVFQKIQKPMGGRLRFFVSAGAALSADVMEFFAAVGLPVVEGYGLTETTSIVAANPEGKMRPGTVGLPGGGVEIKVADDGEILCRGGNVMRGYWNKPQDTAEAIDAEGWFHTGDMGTWTRDGYLQITGRKKDLIVLSNGKNVAPQNIEALLTQSPYIQDVAVMGDGCQNVVALVVPSFKAFQEEYRASKDNAVLVEDPQVRKVIKSEIDRLSESLADFERVRRFALLPEEFSIENGTLTPTLKVKRYVLAQRYRELLAQLTGA